MNPLIKKNLDLLREAANKSKTKAAPKIKSAVVKDDALISVLRNKKEAAAFMARMNIIMNSRKTS